MLIILLCTISMSICAADHLPFSAPMAMPYSSMASANQSSYMTTGSKYTPAVHEVGASSPVAHAPGKRRNGFGDIVVDDGTGTTVADNDPANTQFSPLGNALIPLLIMAFIYAIVLYRRKTKVSDL